MVEDQRQTIMSKPISVLVVEYQPLTRIGIRSVVAGEADIELAGETDNGADGFAEFKRLRPDVTILGLRLTSAWPSA